jgi:hypothetical protein
MFGIEAPLFEVDEAFEAAAVAVEEGVAAGVVVASLQEVDGARVRDCR